MAATALLPTVDDSLDAFSNILARSSIATVESLESLKELARWVLENLSPSINHYNKHAWELVVVAAARAAVAKSSGCTVSSLRDIILPTVVVTQCKGMDIQFFHDDPVQKNLKANELNTSHSSLMNILQDDVIDSSLGWSLESVKYDIETLHLDLTNLPLSTDLWNM